MPKIFNSYIEPKEYQALQLKAVLDEAFREGTFVLRLMLIIGLAIIVVKVLLYLQSHCPHCNGRGHHIVDGHVVNCPQCRDTEEDEVYGITIDEIIELTEDEEE